MRIEIEGFPGCCECVIGAVVVFGLVLSYCGLEGSGADVAP